MVSEAYEFVGDIVNDKIFQAGEPSILLTLALLWPGII